MGQAEHLRKTSMLPAVPVPQNLRIKPLRFIAIEPKNALRDSVTEIITEEGYSWG